MKSWYPVLAALLLLCLAAMPYGYYVLVRFVAMILFALFAYEKWQKEQAESNKKAQEDLKKHVK